MSWEFGDVTTVERVIPCLGVKIWLYLLNLLLSAGSCQVIVSQMWFYWYLSKDCHFQVIHCLSQIPSWLSCRNPPDILNRNHILPLPFIFHWHPGLEIIMIPSNSFPYGKLRRPVVLPAFSSDATLLISFQRHLHYIYLF